MSLVIATLCIMLVFTMVRSFLIVVCLAVPSAVYPDPAEILEIESRFTSDSRLHVSVTIRHGDTGWDDYADGWRVELEDGTILGTRTLYHPHIEEQPFTRSLADVELPNHIDLVYIRARTLTDGWDQSRSPHMLER